MSAANARRIIDQAGIASPCSASWDDMDGDEKTRLCGQCNLNVHNTTVMTDEEVLALILRAASGQRVCARIYKRDDGTVLTSDCPVGLSRLRQRVHQRVQRVAAGIVALLAMAAATAASAAPVRGKASAKPLFRATVTVGESGVGGKFKSGTSTPPVVNLYRTRPMGQMIAPAVSKELIAAVLKNLKVTEERHGTDSLEAAAEHRTLAVMFSDSLEGDPSQIEVHAEAAYQAYVRHGKLPDARQVALAAIQSPALGANAKWTARARAANDRED